ncbi:TadE/TadG family type IV pilus assembly protein [Streptomyces sp. TLI_146]|uniref:TadE/TadG family type IV pilus assembly protein n=1 Tax=Streptomyces sp. TLI_146 TaxID=1938858 RepID=UPI000C703546|nr:pilus assembly protein TadG-related protein [Streptomyces sp. TLI_146]PKV82717.1 putative Flp pilus-assembly TadE/G-like protein [Streptomyces sp. TLI_146]
MHFPQRNLCRARRDDRGGVSVFVAVCVTALIGIIGVAVDGGSTMRAIERTDYLAGEAARAGGQALSPAAAISGTAAVVDPQAAQAAAQAYLRSAGATGTVSVSDGGRTLTVTITASCPTKFLAAVGIGSLPVTGHATATLLHGVTAPEGQGH